MKRLAHSARDQRGEMGVGTLIIFIAMVLVAAVAASVLINVVDKLQEQASCVADDTQDYFNTQLRIINIDPRSEANEYTGMRINAQLAYHSGPVDSHGLIVEITYGPGQKYLFFNEILDDEIEVDEDESRSTYELIWHRPSGFEGRYIQKTHTVQIVLDEDVISEIMNENQGERITVRLIPQNGLETRNEYRVPVLS